MEEEQGTIISQYNLIFKLDEEKKTAALISNSLAPSIDVLIPRSIEYGTQEYLITSINTNSLTFINIKSLEFPPDSKIHKIEKNSLSNATIRNFTIPPNVEELEEGWCQDLIVHNINVLPSSKNYSKFNDDFILRKSDPKSDTFDILILSVSKIENAVIPPFIKVIAPFSFYSRRCIQKVEFSQNSELESIEKFAFFETSIKNITFPSHLKKIGQSSFQNCYELQFVDFEQNSELQLIEKKSFTDTNVKCFTIPTKNVKLEEGWCFYLPRLTHIKLLPNNDNFTKYGKFLILRKSDPKSDIFDVVVFALRNIQHAIIPPFIRIIGPHAFNACSHLHCLIFKGDSKLQSIEKSAFSHTKIKKVTFPPHLTKICEAAFYKCKRLRLVEFAKNSELKIIGKEAFSYTPIEKVTFPYHLTSIGERSFCECNKLNCIEFDPNSELSVIGKYAFCTCPIKDIKFPLHLTCIDEYAFSRTQLNHVEIPENCELKRIEKCPFYYTKIESITFSMDVEMLNEEWCGGMMDLEIIKVVPNNKHYTNFDGENFVLGKSDPKSDIFDILLFARRSIEKATLPSFIKEIGPFSFYLCKNLQQIDIPFNSELQSIGRNSFYFSKIRSIKILPKITKIDDFAFEYCANLQSVEIPLNSELRIIGKSAFSGTSIESIFIPEKVEKICDKTFYNCKNLHRVIFAENSELKIVEEQAFFLSGITDITFPPHLKRICQSAFFMCSKLKTVDFSMNSELKTIEKLAFSSTSIEKLTIPSKVSDLKDGWCDGIYYLNEIKLMPNNENLKKFGNDLIIGKSNPKSDIFDTIVISHRNIQRVVIPSFIKVIESSAFANCKYLNYLEFPKNSQLVVIKMFGFLNICIKTVTLPIHLKEIQRFAFDCPSLKNVEILPESEIKSIPENCFRRGLTDTISLPLRLIHVCRSFGSFKLIEINENSELESLDINAIESSKNVLIMVPAENRVNFTKFV